MNFYYFSFVTLFSEASYQLANARFYILISIVDLISSAELACCGIDTSWLGNTDTMCSVSRHVNIGLFPLTSVTCDTTVRPVVPHDHHKCDCSFSDRIN